MPFVPAIIGIDFGTSYTTAAVFQDGEIHIIPNDQGSRHTPSVVAFTEMERLIGSPAQDQMTLNPTNTLFDVKRWIGRKIEDSSVQADMKTWPFNFISEHGMLKVQANYKGETKTFLPQEICSMIFAKIVESTETYLDEPVTDAVVTIPAGFTNSQRQAIKDAGRVAGINVLRVINGASAAAIAYAFEKKIKFKNCNVLIFDLGGGTCNVSIVTIDNWLVEVRSTTGDNHLGGEDFTSRMVDYFTEGFQTRYNKDLKSNKRALSRLHVACENAKRTLSSTTQAFIQLDSLLDGINYHNCITRSRFEELNAQLFRQALDPVKRALSDAKMSKSKIHDVVLVGGSTRIPKVQQLLQAFFNGKQLVKSMNPDEATARGAAIQAGILNKGSDNTELRYLALLDATPLSLGVKTMRGAMATVIKGNDIVPCKKTHLFTIKQLPMTYQEPCTQPIGPQSWIDIFCCGSTWSNDKFETGVSIQVYEGEGAQTADNNLLGEFELNGIIRAPGVDPGIEITFEVDTNDVLVVTAVIKQSGQGKRITISKSKDRMNEKIIQRMIHEAQLYKADDHKEKERKAAKDALESYCFKFKTKCEGIIKWLDGNQSAGKEEFEQKQKEVEEICNPAEDCGDQ